MKTDPIRPVVYRLPEVCALLDISDDTAHRRIKAKASPFQNAYKDGQWRVPVKDVDLYLFKRGAAVR